MKNKLEQLKEILLNTGQTLCTIESCTGGNIASQITSISGASKFFMGGLIPYDANIKNKILGVNEDLLKQNGVVSTEVAKEMLIQGLNLFGADLGIATTGFAGPSGGNDKYPVGTVIIAYGSMNKNYIETLHFDNKEREDVISETVKKAINLLLDAM